MTKCLTVIGWTLLLASCGQEPGKPSIARTDSGHQPTGAIARGTSAAHAALVGPPSHIESYVIRGAERYHVFCTPCHGADGSGDGPVVRRGFPRPPPFSSARLQTLPPAHTVRVITNGVGVMYPMADRVPPADRWAIAAHVQSLQQRGKGDAP